MTAGTAVVAAIVGALTVAGAWSLVAVRRAAKPPTPRRRLADRLADGEPPYER